LDFKIAALISPSGIGRALDWFFMLFEKDQIENETFEWFRLIDETNSSNETETVAKNSMKKKES
jgi:hypothetical protein